MAQNQNQFLSTLGPGRVQDASIMDVEAARAIQEVQGAIILAKKFPRDVEQARDRMLAAAKRRRLAELAIYEYRRGGEMVAGPSIRLAEMMAQNFMNLDFGIRELEQRNGESTMMAYCWDLETNVRQTRIFTVRHERDRTEGARKLTSQRDIYENNANMGARRLRACILGVLPGDVVDDVVAECERTLITDTVPLSQRVPVMLRNFEAIGVSKTQIEELIGCNVAAITEFQMLRLRKVYSSIKDGMASVDDHFKRGNGPDQSTGAARVSAAIANAPKVEPVQNPAPKVDPEEGEAGPDSFAGFADAPPKPEKPKPRDPVTIAHDIYAEGRRLAYGAEVLNRLCVERMAKNPEQLDAEELEDFLGYLRTLPTQKKAGVK